MEAVWVDAVAEGEGSSSSSSEAPEAEEAIAVGYVVDDGSVIVAEHPPPSVPLHQHRRLKIAFAALGATVLLVIALALGLVFGLRGRGGRFENTDATEQKYSEDEDSEASLSPEGGSRLGEVKRFLVASNVSDLDRIEAFGTPQNLAARWIADFDDRAVSIDDPLFTQRYVLSVMYHSIGGDGWENNAGWVSGTPECDWFGVNTKEDTRCGAGGVLSSIDMSKNKMKGPIPDETGRLIELKYLSLSRNCITGTIPSQLGGLSKLTHLMLESNGLTGSIPIQVQAMTGFVEFRLNNNKLTGEISKDSNLCKLSSDIIVAADCKQCPNSTHILKGGPCCVHGCWKIDFSPCY